ncbi:hypothetical protein C8R43DRAFT_1004450 [Mycena crocata]|nr:hypothetical protein C8R43DRAFT_1004450 [Mycena crocata]
MRVERARLRPLYQLRLSSIHPNHSKHASSTHSPEMNSVFSVGTHIFYWNGAGKKVSGVVQRTARGADGTVYLDIKVDDTGTSVTLPATSVTKVE